MTIENHISNYYLLGRLAKVLNLELAGKKLLNGFSLNKNELLFDFGELTMKVYMGEQAFAFFPANTPAQKQNAKTQFDDLAGKALIRVMVHPHDRSFRMVFEAGLTLVLMLYGRNGDILLFSGNEFRAQFRPQFERYQAMHLKDFDRFTLPTYEDFETVAGEKGNAAAAASLLKGLSAHMLKYLTVHGLDTCPPAEAWNMILSFGALFSNGTIDVVEKEDNTMALSLLPTAEEQRVIYAGADIKEALNAFAAKYFYNHQFARLKNARVQELSAKAAKIKTQLDAANLHIYHLAHESNYKHQADVIMANLHTIKPGATRAVLFDFYEEKEKEFVLKMGLSPQLWAEKLYRKAKNQEIEKQKTKEKIIHLENEWMALSEELEKAAAITDIRVLKTESKKAESAKPVLPFRHFQVEGYDVYVGKNAANNDKLTFGFAHKEDMWLHAMGVSGSHVIIRHRQKGMFPEPVLKKAAGLAAFNSGAKGSQMAPVIYTLRKYVRKPKGAAPGAVICEKEKTIMAEPDGKP